MTKLTINEVKFEVVPNIRKGGISYDIHTEQTIWDEKTAYDICNKLNNDTELMQEVVNIIEGEISEVKQELDNTSSCDYSAYNHLKWEYDKLKTVYGAWLKKAKERLAK